MKLSIEQRLSMAENKLTQSEQDLHDFIDTYNDEYGITRKTGLTLVARNFFTSYHEDSIRNNEGFRAYYLSIDDEYQNNLKLLFKCMSQDILLDRVDDFQENYIDILVHHCPFERPKLIQLVYNESLLRFINSYIAGQINIRFTLEELLIRTIQIEHDNDYY